MESHQEKSSLYRNIVRSQLDSRFNDLENRLGWRPRVLHDSDMGRLEVVFGWNHANFDGISGKIFHETLQRNLNAQNHEAHFAWLDKNSTLLLTRIVHGAFPLPQEQTANYRVTPGYLLSSAWKELRPSLLRRKTTTQATWAPIRSPPLETR